MSYFRLTITANQNFDPSFFDWAWERLGMREDGKGMTGICEGTWLVDPDQPFFDSGVAPLNRDWVEESKVRNEQVSQPNQVELFFSDFSSAKDSQSLIETNYPQFRSCQITQLPDQDWNDEWKRAFSCVEVPPFWKVYPPWEKPVLREKDLGLIINPGTGFGTGTHSTTRLCLEQLSHFELAGRKVLDFGSGSAILAIAAARLGAKVDAVEIDPLAIENGLQNAELNQVQASIDFKKNLDGLQKRGEKFDLILANVLKGVLLEYAPLLVQFLRKDGKLVLSGLLEEDLPAIFENYQKLLSRSTQSSIFSEGEWQAVVFTL